MLTKKLDSEIKETSSIPKGIDKLGNFYLECEKWEKAIEYFNKSLQRDPENVETLKNLAFSVEELSVIEKILND